MKVSFLLLASECIESSCVTPADIGRDAPITEVPAVHVLDEIIEAQNHFHVIGLHLKLPEHEIESIESMHRHPRDRLLHILIEFLKKVDPPPTWRRIVDALRSPSVNLPELANRVENNHCPQTTGAGMSCIA